MTQPVKTLHAAGTGLFECRVTHQRFVPKGHGFSYSIFMLAVDLDDLPSLGRGNPILSVDAFNLYSLNEADYLPTGEATHNPTVPGCGPKGAGLKARVLSFARERGVDLPGGRVLLVTLPRILGYAFNPVSFYFCYDCEGNPAAAIAEVTNTFREIKPYFLGSETFSTEATGAFFQRRTPKHFYVSPFSDVDVEFDFRLGVPGERLSVRIDDYEGRVRTLTSVLTGRQRPLTAVRLGWYAIKYPMMTLRIIVMIHVHALLLKIKRVPWFPKASRVSEQRDLYRPHSSIKTRPIS